MASNPGGATGRVGGTAPKAPAPSATVGIGGIAAQATHPTRPHPDPIRTDPTPVRGTPPGAPGAPGAPNMGPEADLIGTLDAYGLGSLATWAWNEHVAGKNDAQIMLDLRQTDAYKQRFVGMAALQAKGQAITEGQYVAKEQQDTELIRSYGLDVNKYASRQALGNLIANGVSTTELQSRLNLVQSAVMQAPKEARQYLAANFGIGHGDMMDYFLDPNGSMPALQMKAQAASIGGAAAQTGFGYLDVSKALQLAAQGVSASQAQAGFGKIATEGELTHSLGDGSGSVTSNDLVDAQLGGNGNAADKVAKVAGQRVAAFQGGGTYAAGQSGVSGLGVGNQGF